MGTHQAAVTRANDHVASALPASVLSCAQRQELEAWLDRAEQSDD